MFLTCIIRKFTPQPSISHIGSLKMVGGRDIRVEVIRIIIRDKDYYCLNIDLRLLKPIGVVQFD